VLGFSSTCSRLFSARSGGKPQGLQLSHQLAIKGSDRRALQ